MPDDAERQSWPTVRAVLEYRHAVDAVELFNQGAKGAEVLLKKPHLMGILLRMHRAQGETVTAESLIAAMPEPPDDDE